MKFQLSVVLYLFAGALHIQQSAQAPADSDSSAATQQPYRTIAGVSVIDTPIVRSALDLAHEWSSDFVYKHIIRSWLLGVLIMKHNETLRQSVDVEVHAVSAILHDLGWNQGSPFITPDHRFEVDGAFAATAFVKNYTNGYNWDTHRVQLVWDSIAFHSEPSFSYYKEPTVATVSQGVIMDLKGPQYGVTQDEYNAVVKAFPNDDMKAGFNDTLIWLCHSKPATTYDTWQQPFGDAYVANYSAVGSRVFDIAAQL